MKRCPSCGEANPDKAKFCLECGSPLAEASPPEEERRVVTVLFADLVGFTSRSERMDVEDVRGTLQPYHRLLRGELERFGGTVEKFIGDAVMALFGAPTAHEDDPERAVRAALAIQDAIARLREQDERLDLKVRIGVNTGEALVAIGARPAEGEGMASGDVVNTAARLEAAAPADGVLVGESTYRATRRAIQYEDAPAVVAKGKHEPVPAWVAVRARARFGVDATPTYLTPFVGRDHDLAALCNAFSKAVADSAPQLVTIIGEPGVGKSRLVSEFRGLVDARPELIWWRQGRCLPYGDGIALWALGEVVKAHAGILESDGEQEARAKLQAAAGAMEDSDWVMARVAPLAGISTPGAADRRESFTAWRRFLESIATERPLVILFEDLHWADEVLLDFIVHLAGWVEDVPPVIVCTARPELFQRAPAWAGGLRNATTISLSPLADDATAMLLAAVATGLDESERQVLAQRAGGNPFYAEELGRMRAERPPRTVPAGSVGIPESVQAVIAARLDTVSGRGKATLQDAAVVGKVFWAGAVSSIGSYDARTVEEQLHDLARQEFVRRSRSSTIRGDAEYSFWHALVRDVAYGQIPRSQRARKHLAAARWIEKMAGDRIADHADLLAHHFTEALALSQSTGQIEEAESARRRAFHFGVMAAERSERLDPRSALRSYRSALRLLPDPSPEQARALLGLGRILDDLGQYAEAADTLRTAHDTAGDDAFVRADALTSLAHTDRQLGLLDQAIDHLQQALDLVSRLPHSPELARAHAMLASAHMLRSRHDETLASADEAIRLGRLTGDDLALSVGLQARGTARAETGDAGGLDDLEEAVRVIGVGRGAGAAAVNLADATWHYRGVAPALELLETTIARSEARGVEGDTRWAQAERLWLLGELGRWDELLDAADALIGDDRAQDTLVAALAATQAARILVRRGRMSDAQAFLPRFEPLAESDEPQLRLPALATAAMIHRAAGAHTAAVASLVAFADTQGQTEQFRAWQLPDVVRTALALDQVDLAKTVVATVQGHGLAPPIALRGAHAALSEHDHDDRTAATLYQDAARHWHAYGQSYESAHAYLGAARCLRRIGQRAAATDALGHARHHAELLQAHPLVYEATRELQAVHV